MDFVLPTIEQNKLEVRAEGFRKNSTRLNNIQRKSLQNDSRESIFTIQPRVVVSMGHGNGGLKFSDTISTHYFAIATVRFFLRHFNFLLISHLYSAMVDNSLYARKLQQNAWDSHEKEPILYSTSYEKVRKRTSLLIHQQSHLSGVIVLAIVSITSTRYAGMHEQKQQTLQPFFLAQVCIVLAYGLVIRYTRFIWVCYSRHTTE